MRIPSVAGALMLTTVGVHAACLAPGVAPTPTNVVDAQFAYYNAHDIDGFASCYAEDVEMNYLDGSRSPVHGRAGVLSSYAFLARMPKAMGVRKHERIVTGPTVIDRESVVGLPGGKTAPDLAAVYEVRDGVIAKVWFPPTR